MIRSLIESLLVICFFSACCVFGQVFPKPLDERSQRLANLMARVSAHEAQVTQLLSKGPVPRTNFDLPPPVKRTVPATPPPKEKPFIPVPLFPENVDGDTVREVPAPPSVDDLVSDPNAIQNGKKGDDSNSSLDANSSEVGEDLDAAFAKLYDSDAPSRHRGYYFGPLIGLIFPSDVSTRTSVPSVSKTSYKSNSGYLIGLQGGKDFGKVRLEAEYTYNSFDASSGLNASIHNFFSRLIMEMEIADRVDVRTGLGMGVGFVNLERGQEFSGVGFAYDFLLGVAYRIDENWGVQVDYRYFLNAANDEYDRVKSHVWLVSASLDL